MPSGYAHKKFGDIVLQQLPCDKANLINQYRDTYNIGIHGPDILFYYNALVSNPVSKMGFALHDDTGEQFFTRAKEVLKHKDSDAQLAYIYGVLCHFALDSYCHGYVEHYIQTQGVKHTIIENEFDRYLMAKDGLNVCAESLVKHIKPTNQNAAAMYKFFAPITQAQAKKSLRDSVFYNNLLVTPNKLHRGIKFWLLKLVGQYEKRQEYFITYQADPLCDQSNVIMQQLFDQAVPVCAELITNFQDFVDDKAALHPIYNYTFAGIPYDNNGLFNYQ